jgi:hypothetical protein
LLLNSNLRYIFVNITNWVWLNQIKYEKTLRRLSWGEGAAL